MFPSNLLDYATISVIKVCQSIIKSGSTKAGVNHAGIPLKYEWHEKEYIGAAHGYLGILFQLLHVSLVIHYFFH